MGTPKELLDWGGQPLILHLAKAIVHEQLPCLVISNRPERLPSYELSKLGVTIKPDEGGSYGPISGIVTGFQHTEAETLLVVSCDLPFLDEQAIGQLLAFARREQEWDALVAASGQKLHPLLAVYHRRTEACWREALQAGQYRLMDTLARLRMKIIPPKLLDRWATYNANTPEQYREALLEKCRREAEAKQKQGGL
ncbi:hypothetical protein GCM10023228_16810 [Brevibacillus fulvus]